VTFVAVASSLMAQIFAYGRQAIDRGDASRAALGVSSLRRLLSIARVAGRRPASGAQRRCGTARSAPAGHVGTLVLEKARRRLGLH
jgi:hypothetical protein